MAITSNINAYLKAQEARQREMERALSRATKMATVSVYAAGTQHIKKDIYAKPIPTLAQIAAEKGLVTARGEPAQFITTKTGKVILVPLGKRGRQKAWIRTGNLKRAEKFRMVKPTEGLIENAVKNKKGYPYAWIRHQMSRPGHRRTRFPAHWRDDAIAEKRQTVTQIYHDELIGLVQHIPVPKITTNVY